tara:strand:+ start:173466 stop:174206 length:741 start_codon:yes stop_codon:yes gene_type:complete
MTLYLPALTILNIDISENGEGMFSLSDLWKATGQKKHAPKEWLRLKRTKNLIKELADLRGGISPLSTGRGKDTFVCRELVYSYAMTVSAKFEIEVIHAFDKSARKKLNQASLHGKAEWQKNRELGKLTHRNNTETIKGFISYAVLGGSQGYQKNGYAIITKMINTTMGIDARDSIDEQQLHLLSTAELICDRTLVQSMSQGLPYKTIYKQAKQNIETFARLAMINTAGKKEAPTSDQTERSFHYAA